MADTHSWADDINWTEPLNRFQELAQIERATLVFDIKRLEEALYDSAVFQHVDYILQAEQNPSLDGRRYVPRLMMALLMILHDESHHKAPPA